MALKYQFRSTILFCSFSCWLLSWQLLWFSHWFQNIFSMWPVFLHCYLFQAFVWNFCLDIEKLGNKVAKTREIKSKNAKNRTLNEKWYTSLETSVCLVCCISFQSVSSQQKNKAVIPRRWIQGNWKRIPSTRLSIERSIYFPNSSYSKKTQKTCWVRSILLARFDKNRQF